MKPVNRRAFLNQSCPVLVSFLVGGTLLKSCSPDELGATDTIVGGFSIDGNTLTIDLSHPDFGGLKTKGWVNFSAQKVLILKKSDTQYQAFSNRCPHEGVRNRWSYSENNQTFVCKEHNNAYATDCQSNGKGGGLACYATQVSGNTLMITLA